MRSCSRKALSAVSSVSGLALVLGAGAVGAEEAITLDEVEVIGITPVHGVGLPRDMVPSNVQSATDRELDETKAISVSDFMQRRLGSVHINEAQNNPLQPDVQYRGFTASPLLGLPQGLSVYMDGVRINEAFGDTLNWDLIPESALAEVNLIPGSNPLFGRNTLGGALSLETKNGFTHPGTRGEVYGGSFGRRAVQAETGGSSDGKSYFLTADYFEEDGWRDYSPSDAKRLFGNLGWQGEDSNLDFSVLLGDTKLIGNGPLPIQLLQTDREAIFTRPDITENELSMFTLSGDRFIGQDWVVGGNVYFRRNQTDTLNGDDSDFEECDADPGLICEEDDDEIVTDTDGNPVAADDSVEGGTINTSQTEQDAYGATLQATLLRPLAGRENQFIVGAEIAQSQIDFFSQTELGSLDDTRRAVGSGIIVGDSLTDLRAETKDYALFVTDTLSVTDALSVTLSGRYNITDVELNDQLGTALNGDHRFERFNPAIGATYDLSSTTNVYGGYSESNRVPTPVELTCADPDDPCRLPNAFLADPPLDDVVAKTWEAGIRGRTGTTRWNLGVFTTKNEDDILFISAGALTNQGYFDNVGETRRRGVELNLTGRATPQVGWYLNYTYLDATFQTPLTIASENNPAAIDGEIQVEKGDRIPGVPRHMAKAGLDWAATDRIRLRPEAVYHSDQVLRGDESNQLDTVDEYVVVNLLAEYQISDSFEAFARIDNVFDTDYETFGLLGEPDEVLGTEYDDPRFLSPGAPRGAWVGVSMSF